jgi:hypothetical protein
MRVLFLRVIVSTATLVASVTFAQMHRVAKPQQVVRAIGVYEWTGDFAKPTASRLIPVSLYIDGKFEDAGIYIARPVPFALLSGNLYLLQSAGIDKGTLDLAYAKHLQAVSATGDLAYDDGWFGYGSVKPLAAPRKTTAALKPSKTLPVIAVATDPNRPHFGSKPSDTVPATSDQSKSTPTPSTTTATNNKPDATAASSTANSSSSDDPDRPTMKRRDNSGTTTASTAPADQGSTTSSTANTAATPADDPDRPTMKRRTPDSTSSGSDTTTTASTTQTGSTSTDDPDRSTMKRRSSDNTTTDTASTSASSSEPADNDPDRPTLKRRTPEQAKKTGSTANDTGGLSGAESLNDDPNRPNLHHGKPTSSMTEDDLPKLTGLPSNLHQMVAVSDAVNRDPHSFTLDWDDEAQHQAVLAKMQDMARTQLAAYNKPPATTPVPAAKKNIATSTQSRRTAKPAPTPQQPLLDEQLNAYTLSYGGDPTYIYSANTGGTGAALRYVTIVAQTDSLGEIKPAIQSVTDAAHLYRTPKMQFVDVVDAEASNRASLLFELRSQNSRQFALYRVIASHPEQIFLTGSTQ